MKNNKSNKQCFCQENDYNYIKIDKVVDFK